MILRSIFLQRQLVRVARETRTPLIQPRRLLLDAPYSSCCCNVSDEIGWIFTQSFFKCIDQGNLPESKNIIELDNPSAPVKINFALLMTSLFPEKRFLPPNTSITWQLDREQEHHGVVGLSLSSPCGDWLLTSPFWPLPCFPRICHNPPEIFQPKAALVSGNGRQKVCSARPAPSNHTSSLGRCIFSGYAV